MAGSGPTKDVPQQLPGIPWMRATGPVQRVEMEFEIFSGADRQSVGTGQHSYVSENGESYGLNVRQMPQEDSAGPGGPWQLEISGLVNKQGLSPLLFQIKGVLPERLMSLKEVPDSLPSSASSEARNGRLPDGLLDRQSLLYQFMQVPPDEGGGKLWLSDGKTHRLYTYRVAGSEPLVIAANGEVRAMKLVLSASVSADIIELWLVPDLHYLPAKVRYIDARGGVTEQVVTSLKYK